MSVYDYVVAARLPAYPIIALPIYIATCLASLVHKSDPSVHRLAVLHVNGLLLMAHVLFLNDYADEETDKLNKNYFNSGGSRVIVDGKLCGADLYYAAILVGKIEIVVSILTMLQYDLVYMPVFAIIGCSFGWLYSIPPFRLSYKGLGELIQGVSLGLCLPMMGFYVSSGTLANYPYYTSLVLIPVFYASNVVHALPDYPSDKQSNRLTHVVLFGEFASRKFIILCYFISTLAAVYFRPNRGMGSSDCSYIYLLLFDLIILAIVLWNGLFHNAGVLNSVNKGKACHMFVRLNMFAMIGHLCLWLFTVNYLK